MPLRVEHHLYIHGTEDPRLNTILEKLNLILTKETQMAGELAVLTQEVAETKTVVGSAIVLLQGLKERLDAAIASGDPAALTALSASLDADQQALAAAITANTPAG